MSRVCETLLAGLLISLLVPPVTVGADPGDLDPTFSADGIVRAAIGAGNDLGRAVAIQPDGKIVVAGASVNNGAYDFAVARYNSDGNPDSTFATTGKVMTAVGAGADFGYALAIQPDGKIVAAGYTDNGGGDFDFALVRYNTDGSLDASFDADGIVTTPIGTHLDSAYAIAIQTDGKIVAAGFSTNAFGVARYNSDGSLDNTFHSDGKVVTAVGGIDDRAYAVAIQPDGKIVVAGVSLNGAYDFAVVRYNTDGSLDTSFSTDGKVTTPILSGDDSGKAIAIQADGKILVAGYTDNGSNNDFAVVRYNTDGSPDTSFDTDGKLTTPIGSGHDYGYAIAIQADGKILVAGRAVGTNFDFALARYNSDGGLDNSFSSDGKLTTAIYYFNDAAYGLAVQRDGKVVVVGESYNGGNDDFALARYDTAESASETVQDGAISSGLPGVAITNHSGSTCTFTVVKYPAPPGGSPVSVGEMPFYWDISSTCDPVNVDLVFIYTDAELLNANSVTEAQLRAFKNTSGTWVNQSGTYTWSLDTDANTLTVSGVTSLSSWTLADLDSGPTATRLQCLSASTSVNGRLLFSLGLLGMLVVSFGLFWWTRAPRRRPRLDL